MLSFKRLLIMVPTVFLIAAGGCSAGNSFMNTEGTAIVGEGNSYRIRGISFTNEVYDNPELPPDTHHTEKSYEVLKKLGINTVRFYLNYGLFEDDGHPYEYKESGFLWLDRNIEWAQKYGIRLILNMHYPQGGYQSGNLGSALWREEENQSRLAALWQEIAVRYRNEETILGYGLLNEPTPPAQDSYEETVEMWRDLAQNLVKAVRHQDQNHIIFIEQVHNISEAKASWSFPYGDERNFVEIKDFNYVYEFHYYNPVEFTHQGLSWYPAKEGYYYPGAQYGMETKPQWIKGETLPLTHVREGAQSFESVLFQPEDSTANLLNFTVNVPIETIIVTEYGPDMERNLAYFEGENFYSDPQTIRTGFSFQIKKDCSYQLLFTVQKGIGAQADVTANADYYYASYSDVLDRSFLQKQIENYLAVGEKRGVPMYLGETGTTNKTMENGLGGEIWLSDILQIAQENELGFTVHSFHEENGFGLYTDESGKYPEALNRKMYEVLKSGDAE